MLHKRVFVPATIFFPKFSPPANVAGKRKFKFPPLARWVYFCLPFHISAKIMLSKLLVQFNKFNFQNNPVLETCLKKCAFLVLWVLLTGHSKIHTSLIDKICKEPNNHLSRTMMHSWHFLYLVIFLLFVLMLFFLNRKLSTEQNSLT